MKLKTLGASSLALLLTVLVTISCEDSFGIYATIQQEKSSSFESQFKKTAVRDVVAFKGKYFVPLVSIFARNNPGTVATDWKPEAIIGSDGNDYTTWGLAATSTTLYAAIQEGTTSSAETGRAIYTTTDGISWSKMTSSLNDSYVLALWSINDRLFAVKAKYEMTGSSVTSTTYTLCYLDTATNDFVATGLSSTYPFVRGAYFNGEYWFAVQASAAALTSALYHSSTPGSSWVGANTSAFTSATGTLSTDNYLVKDSGTASTATAVFISAMAPIGNSALALGATNGYVHLMDTSYTIPSAGGKAATASTSNPVTCLLAVPSSSSAAGILLAGSYMTASDSSAGYMESVVSGASLGAFVLGSSGSVGKATYNSTMADVPLINFVLVNESSSVQRLFACTASAATKYSGLWTTSFDGSSWSSDGWVSE